MPSDRVSVAACVSACTVGAGSGEYSSAFRRMMLLWRSVHANLPINRRPSAMTMRNRRPSSASSSARPGADGSRDAERRPIGTLQTAARMATSRSDSDSRPWATASILLLSANPIQCGHTCLRDIHNDGVYVPRGFSEQRVVALETRGWVSLTKLAYIGCTNRESGVISQARPNPLRVQDNVVRALNDGDVAHVCGESAVAMSE